MHHERVCRWRTGEAEDFSNNGVEGQRGASHPGRLRLKSAVQNTRERLAPSDPARNNLAGISKKGSATSPNLFECMPRFSTASIPRPQLPPPTHTLCAGNAESLAASVALRPLSVAPSRRPVYSLNSVRRPFNYPYQILASKIGGFQSGARERQKFYPKVA